MLNLNLYTINDEYVNYLRNEEIKVKGESKVSINYDNDYMNRKPYVGIIIEVNSFKYFAPLTHPKHHYDENRHFFNRISSEIKINGGRSRGRIMYCYMLPVPEGCYEVLQINQLNDVAYKYIVMEQYFYINDKNNMKKIIDMATNLYKKIKENPNHFLSNACCDYAFLEEKCKEWVLKHNALKKNDMNSA